MMRLWQCILFLALALVSAGVLTPTIGATKFSPPGSFSLISPNQTNIKDTLIAFIWHAAIDPDSGDEVRYTLRLVAFVVPPFRPDTLLVEDLADSTVIVRVKPDRGFYWRVFAIDQSFDTTASVSELWFSNCDCGNVDGQPIFGAPDISDAVFLISFIFFGGLVPEPLCMGDADGSGGTPDISDAVFIISYIWGGGPAPCCQAPCP